ncbi:hypothetical protein ALC62_08103 [Cyphomyrmex costatus]|uniref:Uncharacterized protein n=1 Tax=Cyphomyrmex costatus TaxID=456900 RepID=A0A195CJI5_9HYME|nr:hypothetical protein ALC62_08103 [Cyphomyrmex costatus]
MPIVDLLYHHGNLRPLVSRCASANAIDLQLSACCESSPPETINPFVEFQQATNMRLLSYNIVEQSGLQLDVNIGRLAFTNVDRSIPLRDQTLINPSSPAANKIIIYFKIRKNTRGSFKNNLYIYIYIYIYIYEGESNINKNFALESRESKVGRYKINVLMRIGSMIRTWMPLHIGRIEITRKFCHNSGIYAVDDTANFFKCSINTCKLTSSVRTGAPLS